MELYIICNKIKILHQINNKNQRIYLIWIVIVVQCIVLLI